MPINNMMALRLGRSDLAQFSAHIGGDVTDVNSYDATGASNTGIQSSLTLGRAGLAVLLVIVGAIAASYLATRARQF